LRCRFCQNADIAQMPADHKGIISGDTVTPPQYCLHLYGAHGLF
jgi:pyruvate-formate lyase-activating enzyme